MSIAQLPLFAIGEPDPVASAVQRLARHGLRVGVPRWNAWFGWWEYPITWPRRYWKPDGHQFAPRVPWVTWRAAEGLIGLAETLDREGMPR